MTEQKKTRAPGAGVKADDGCTGLERKHCKKSISIESQQVFIAVELINLGARLQLMQAETSLNRSQLLRLYKEIKGGVAF